MGDVYRDTDGYLSHPSLSEETVRQIGSRVWTDAIDEKLNLAVSDLVGEVTSQYLIFFVSDNPKNKAYRNLKVIVDLPGLRVRARKGYYAASVSGGS
jgi:hypothetical protein